MATRSTAATRIPRPWLEQHQRELHLHNRRVAAKSRELNAPVWDSQSTKPQQEKEENPLAVLWKKLSQGFCPPRKEQEPQSVPSTSHQFPPSPLVIYAMPPPYQPYHSPPTGVYGPPWPAAPNQVPYAPHYMDPQQHHHQQHHHAHGHHPPALISRSERMYSSNTQWTDASGGSFVRVPLHRSIPFPPKSSLRNSSSASTSTRRQLTRNSVTGRSPMGKLRRSVSENTGKPPLYSYRPKNAALARSATVGSTASQHSRHNAIVQFDWNELYLPPDDGSTIESIGTISTKETKNNKAAWMLEWVNQGPNAVPTPAVNQTPSPAFGVTWADQQPPSPPPPPPPLQITTRRHPSQPPAYHRQPSSSPSSALAYSSASTTASPSSGSSWSTSPSSPSSSLSSLSPVPPFNKNDNHNAHNNNWYYHSSPSPPSSAAAGRRERRRRSLSGALTYLPKNRKLEQNRFSADVPLVSGWLSYTLGCAVNSDCFQVGYFVALPTSNTLYLYPSRNDERNLLPEQTTNVINVSDDDRDDESTSTATTTATSTTSGGGPAKQRSSLATNNSTNNNSNQWVTIPIVPEKKAYVEMKMISPALGKAVLVKTMATGDTMITLLPVGLDGTGSNKRRKKKATTNKSSSIAPVAQHDAALHLLFALDGWIRTDPVVAAEG